MFSMPSAMVTGAAQAATPPVTVSSIIFSVGSGLPASAPAQLPPTSTLQLAT
ncbi:hypothetical protein [Ramlibacter montanisoli]|uniref:hypothetical protein n=1 Tax=Ramlibacter montanisoli TaxID=2732512 RepID=UPI00209C4B1D|nr:hypothetical protein [Ramlibacter montanisoli]